MARSPLERAEAEARSAALLLLRAWLAWTFLEAGWIKLAGGLTPPDWFAGLAFPWPQAVLPVALNWVMAGVGEVALGAALLLGLGTRFAALGLLYITFVAVYTVHFDLGWAGWNQIETEAGQGFKVPLMIGLMLLLPLTQGAGGWSLDAAWSRWRRRAVGTLPA